MTTTHRLTRADYDTHKAAFIAKLKLEMEVQGLTPASLAAKSKKRALALETDTSISEVNVYHYKGGISMPTPKKLIELATCLGVAPHELMPKAIMGQRRYVARRYAVASTAHTSPNHGSSTRPFTVNVAPGPTPGTVMLNVQAVMDPAHAHPWARALTRKLGILKIAADEGITEQAAESLLDSAAALRERMGS